MNIIIIILSRSFTTNHRSLSLFLSIVPACALGYDGHDTKSDTFVPRKSREKHCEFTIARVQVIVPDVEHDLAAWTQRHRAAAGAFSQTTGPQSP